MPRFRGPDAPTRSFIGDNFAIFDRTPNSASPLVRLCFLVRWPRPGGLRTRRAIP